VREPRRFRRGIYLLPTLFTIGNMFCGYTSVVQSAAGNLELAAMLIVLAAVLDALDGRIARLTGAQSDFGVEFDSLADVVSFGIAPALLAHEWALGAPRLGGSLAFLYLACAAMRLARFNIATSVHDKRYFIGLPSPMAGTTLASIVHAFPEPTGSKGVALAFATLVFCVAVMMVGKLRYRSFRELDLRNRRSYVSALPMAAVLVAVALHPKAVLLALSASYLLSAPAVYVWTLVRRGRGSVARLTAESGPAPANVADERAR
jgi:CDP-diacylglycerol--serine O-phosphatidyltransferase